VTEFARRLGVACVALSRVPNGEAAISAEMAIRPGAALGDAPAMWVHLKAAFSRLAPPFA